MTSSLSKIGISLAEYAERSDDPLGTLIKAWLSGQRSPRTFVAYEIAIRQWVDWCGLHGVDPLGALRAHVELYQRWLERDDRKGKGIRKPRTIYSKLAAMASFYDYLIVEDVLIRDPMRGVKRPRIDRKSPTAWLSTAQLADLIGAAKELGPNPYALVLILALNGLRIGEVCSLNIDSVSWDGYSPIITFRRKGEKDGRATLTRPTENAVFKAIGERTEGPLLLNKYGNRMTQRNAQLIIDKAIGSIRGGHGRITPHSLRHSWCTGCREAQVPLDQIQHDGGWSDGRIVAYYSHGFDRPDRAATHGITARVMGAA